MPRGRGYGRRGGMSTMQHRIMIETAFTPNTASNTGVTILLMKLMGRGEIFTGANIEWNAWAFDTAPWIYDMFWISVPLEIDPSEILTASTEAGAIGGLNTQASLTRIRNLVEMHLTSSISIPDEFNHPTDAVPQDDIRNYFDRILPRRIHHKSHNLIPLVNAVADSTSSTFKTFARKHSRIRLRGSLRYAKPSVLCFVARHLRHNTDVTGPWDAAGNATLTEAEWRYLIDPTWRRADDDISGGSGINAGNPWILPRADKLVDQITDLLNFVAFGNIYTVTNHPLADRVL